MAVFNIEGMDCAGCVGTIHAALSKAAGVRSASVLFKEKQAKVTYDSSVTNPDRLIAVVASTHYARHKPILLLSQRGVRCRVLLKQGPRLFPQV